jgi:hypothetical protein
MSAVDDLEHELETAGRAAWPRVKRFASGFVTASAGALATAGLQRWSWSLLAGVAAGAVVAGLGEMYPSIPWQTVYGVLAKHRPILEAPAPAPVQAPVAAMRAMPPQPPMMVPPGQ